ncbi:LysR substrate-binding domain-containing protein [Paraburkholderia sejongensis]|uniref:LysR substrate-binding domain-containing protein n=1 Tax=Paraburkholderia sejongensis TaxID=2886946 RepID=UPI002E7763B8|nr:LysR substrate-binding domain-containing protein [Paraburkholderia sp. MMS20-SJTR3]
MVFGRHHVAPVLLDLARRHPALRIEASFSDRVADFVDEGIDLAVRSGALPESDTLVARPLGMQVMAVCASTTYLETHGTPSTLSDLTSHRCIDYMHAGRRVPWSFTDERGDIVQPAFSGQLGFDDIDTIAEAAIRGEGLAHLPLWRVREALDDGRLVRVLTQVPSARTPLHLIWPRMRFLPYKMRVTIDALLSTLPSQLPAE